MTSEETEQELEALESIYEGAVERISNSPEPTSLRVSVALEPHTAENDDLCFVQCRLHFLLGPAYPGLPPELSLRSVLGLGDARQAALLKVLRQEASKLVGEPATVQLCEAAKDWLTQNNEPEGSCIFCCCSMRETVGSVVSGLLKLPCYHVFHRSCFASWWAWMQADLHRQHQELIVHTGASAASYLTLEKLPPKEHGWFQTQCPSCRAAVPLEHLKHIRTELQHATAALSGSAMPSSLQTHGSVNDTAADGESGGTQQAGSLRQSGTRMQSTDETWRGNSTLTDTALHAWVQNLQKHRLAVFARQKAGGGIIDSAA